MKKVIKIFICILCLFMNCCFLLNFDLYAENIDLSFDSLDLYNETNTYKYRYDQVVPEEGFNNTYRYDVFSKKKTNIVDDGAPMITILTHGLGGRASDWSNDGNENFVYNKDSLITRLFNLCDSNVYKLLIKDNNVCLTNLTDVLSIGMENEEFLDVKEPITSLNDISKHIILVYERKYSYGTNDSFYSEFNYAVSRVIYQVKQLNNGKLPKINLIGHSRGGLTNLQYALDHPDLVSSLYSLGTPYCGSTSASIDALFLNHSFGGNQGGEDDIVNEQVYSTYLNNWNNNYDLLYSHIKVLALGGYTSFNHLAKFLYSTSSLNMFDEQVGIKNDLALAIAFAVDVLITEINNQVIKSKLASGIYLKYDIVKNMLYKIFEKFSLYKDLSMTALDDMIKIFLNEIDYSYEYFDTYWKNDGLVDLASQQGYYRGSKNNSIYTEFKGFERKTKLFTYYNCDFDKTARTMVSVVHNLETRDTQLLTYITKDISMGSNTFETYYVSETEVGILSYIGNSGTSSLVIPEVIDGKRVVEIGANAFADNFYKNENILEIIISPSIIKIGNNAFANCTNLEHIDFTYASELHVLGDEVFLNCSKIQSLRLPDSLVSIGQSSFKSSGIKNIEINENNPNFKVIDNTLYDDDKTELILSPMTKELTVPDTVKYIREYAFSNNTLLEGISLNNTTDIEKGAFSGCENLKFIEGNYVLFAEKETFIDTRWYKEPEESRCLGHVLIEYRGNEDSYTIPSEITHISSNAFESPYLKDVYIKNNVKTINPYAFTGCENLKGVYLLEICAFNLYDNSFKEGTKFYVPEGTQNNYLNNEDYFYYEICVPIENVHFYLEDELVETRTIKFFEELPEVSVSKEGYTFNGWMVNGKKYHTGTPLDVFGQDIILKAVMTPNTYKAYLESYMTVKATYGLLLPNSNKYTITKDGYTFFGWYTEDDLCFINESGKPIRRWNYTNDIELYAKWKVIEYRISYNLNGGENTILSAINPTKYTIEKKINLNSPSRFGYEFSGWNLNGKIVYTIPQGTYGHLSLTAMWDGVEMSLDKNTTSRSIAYAYAVILLPEEGFTYPCKLTIQSTVKSIYLFSNNPNVIYNLSLNFNQVKSNINVYLNNVYIAAPNDTSAISFMNNYIMHMYIKGTVKIYGGNGSITSTNGNNGANAIECYKLDISGKGSLLVVGGNGANGANGINGVNGTNGLKGPCGSFFSPKKGEDGKSGTNGTNGYNGGNGGFGIYAINSITMFLTSYEFIGGNGGNGGTGGKEGKGGDSGGNGPNGINGSSGYNGINGIDGVVISY